MQNCFAHAEGGGGYVAVLREAVPPRHPHGYAEQMYDFA